MSTGDRRTVAVTGAASGIGQALTERLVASERFARVIALDGTRGEVPGAVWRVVDIRDPALARRLSDVDVLVHVDVDRSPESDPKERRTYNVRGAQTVIACAAGAGVKDAVLLSSAAVYGAAADNPVPLPENAPLKAEPDTSVAGDFLEIEELAGGRLHPGLRVTVVRPAALVGPGVDTVVTRHFEAPRLLRAKGVEPRWQFCHVDDLVAALELAALGEVSGAIAVGSEGFLTGEEVERITGKAGFELPASLTFGTAQRLHRLGLTPAPATDLHYVVYPWVVDCAKLRASGWKPRHDNEMALQALLAETAGRHAVVGRRVGGKEATMATAAGATVAVIGAAAAVRRARRRRRL
ncbi:NAD-dependent epimerase/dehydratase family protein [Actinocorallia sp. A-T 12471]|uniref:NAD-dependent epimerase/dehydratase family protein n=1 Tax=Actinocorallia sp. A-T 12471 TaxID=3089813 RepID=UPI0029D24EDA|nr:NAD-dependent epimerase/dehydratase family protein [Actinocorallia sp. A-T 12471]MDX6738847.1 NAD-dependent epimerase/dehydratase family protein [Actinocorallia sp. A-T 12471]